MNKILLTALFFTPIKQHSLRLVQIKRADSCSLQNYSMLILKPRFPVCKVFLHTVPARAMCLLKLLLRLLAAGMLELLQPLHGLLHRPLSVDLVVSRADVHCAAGFLFFTNNKDEVILC